MTDEQKQKQREAKRRDLKKYRDNMSDELKQKDYQKEYRKNYYAAKKLNKIINGNKTIDDTDFYCISIIVK